MSSRPAGGWLHSSADPATGVCDHCGEFTSNIILEENLGCCSIGCVLNKKKEEEENNKDLLPCRACSAYFHPDISADGYHCSLYCAMNYPPFSGGILPPPELAPLEAWVALGHALPPAPSSPRSSGAGASPPASPKLAAASSGGASTELRKGPLLKRSTSTSPAYEAEKLQMDLCQHWWPLNAPTRCPYC
jgi:hypothetical protein